MPGVMPGGAGRRRVTGWDGLVVRDVLVRAVVVPLRRPLATKVGDFSRWPLLLIDVSTEQGIVGRSYLAPYLDRAATALLPPIRDLGAGREGGVACCASPRPVTGWNGRTGPTLCWPTRSRSAPASCTCQMSPATAWNGTTCCRLPSDRTVTDQRSSSPPDSRYAVMRACLTPQVRFCELRRRRAAGLRYDGRVRPGRLG
jgi:hypothetical protein